jgi:hypothetical protein
MSEIDEWGKKKGEEYVPLPLFNNTVPPMGKGYMSIQKGPETTRLERGVREGSFGDVFVKPPSSFEGGLDSPNMYPAKTSIPSNVGGSNYVDEPLVKPNTYGPVGTFQVEGEGSPVREINDDYWKSPQRPGAGSFSSISGSAAGPAFATPMPMGYDEEKYNEQVARARRDQAETDKLVSRMPTEAEKYQNFRDRMTMESSSSNPAQREAANQRILSADKLRASREVADSESESRRYTADTAAQGQFVQSRDRNLEMGRKQTQDATENQFKAFELRLKEADTGMKHAEIIQKIRSNASMEPLKRKELESKIAKINTEIVGAVDNQDFNQLWALKEKIKSDPMNPAYEKEYNDTAEAWAAYHKTKEAMLRKNPGIAFPTRTPKLGATFDLDGSGDLYQLTKEGIVKVYDHATKATRS